MFEMPKPLTTVLASEFPNSLLVIFSRALNIVLRQGYFRPLVSGKTEMFLCVVENGKKSIAIRSTCYLKCGINGNFAQQ